jgi:hypothetical protein
MRQRGSGGQGKLPLRCQQIGQFSPRDFEFFFHKSCLAIRQRKKRFSYLDPLELDQVFQNGCRPHDNSSQKCPDECSFRALSCASRVLTKDTQSPVQSRPACLVASALIHLRRAFLLAVASTSLASAERWKTVKSVGPSLRRRPELQVDEDVAARRRRYSRAVHKNLVRGA